MKTRRWWKSMNPDRIKRKYDRVIESGNLLVNVYNQANKVKNSIKKLWSEQVDVSEVQQHFNDMQSELVKVRIEIRKMLYCIESWHIKHDVLATKLDAAHVRIRELEGTI